MGAIGGVSPAIACLVQSPVLEDLGKAVPSQWVLLAMNSELLSGVGGSLGFAAVLIEVRTR